MRQKSFKVSKEAKVLVHASSPQTECKEGKDVVSLSFDYAGKHYSLSFDKTKRYGCEIEVK